MRVTCLKGKLEFIFFFELWEREEFFCKRTSLVRIDFQFGEFSYSWACTGEGPKRRTVTLGDYPVMEFLL